jgi:NAD(P)-dependent dehydrogenase (short-subunit alcohol dehydrogenase family)
VTAPEHPGTPLSFGRKVALVTGAASGIGAAVSRVLADRECRLVLIDLNASGLAAVAAELPPETEALTVVADVSDEADVERVFAEALDRFGTVDLLHNNAGLLGEVGPLVDAQVEMFDRIMRVNTRSAFLFLRKFLQVLVEQKKPGAAVNTASAAGLKGGKGLAAYSMSKAAVIGLTRSAAVEAGPLGIRINAVCPGRINTPMIAGMLAIAPQEVAVVDRPISRTASPYEVAYLVVWLLSDEASFATGGIYPIDGGFTT